MLIFFRDCLPQVFFFSPMFVFKSSSFPTLVNPQESAIILIGQTQYYFSFPFFFFLSHCCIRKKTNIIKEKRTLEDSDDGHLWPKATSTCFFPQWRWGRGWGNWWIWSSFKLQITLLWMCPGSPSTVKRMSLVQIIAHRYVCHLNYNLQRLCFVLHLSKTKFFPTWKSVQFLT